MTKPRFIRPWVGNAGGQLYGEPHTWLLLSARNRKSGYVAVGMTILLRGEGLFHRIYFGHNGIVIPTGAQRSGGTCCISHGGRYEPRGLNCLS
jgi:hypothetical protein